MIEYDPSKELPDLKGVLRKVMENQNDCETMLCPASGAVRILLRLGIENNFTFETIKAAVALWSKESRRS